MVFIIIATILFMLISSIFGFKKGGTEKVLIFFCILEVIYLLKYGFTGSLIAISIWNFIVLIGVINGIVKGKGELYLSEKYDDRHNK